MEPLLLKAILKTLAKSILLTAVIAGGIGLFGYLKHWDSNITYSNVFFLAGGVMIILGAMSRLTAGESWNTFQLISAESFRGMSTSERANFIIEASSSMSALILGVLSGIFLIILSAIAAYLF